jgi:hypothetical protein
MNGLHGVVELDEGVGWVGEVRQGGKPIQRLDRTLEQ